MFSIVAHLSVFESSPKSAEMLSAEIWNYFVNLTKCSVFCSCGKNDCKLWVWKNFLGKETTDDLKKLQECHSLCVWRTSAFLHTAYLIHQDINNPFQSLQVSLFFSLSTWFRVWEKTCFHYSLLYKFSSYFLFLGVSLRRMGLCRHSFEVYCYFSNSVFLQHNGDILWQLFGVLLLDLYALSIMILKAKSNFILRQGI